MERMLDTRLFLAVAALLCFLIAPIPVAGAASDAGGPQAQASVSVNKKIKKLSRKVRRLKRQVKREKGDPRRPTGRAGGDLIGSYPDPSIGTGAVNSAKVADGSLGGADINPGTTIDLGPQQPRTPFATLSADGLSTGQFSTSASLSTAVDLGGVEVNANAPALGEQANASLAATRLFFDREPGSRVTFGSGQPAPPLTPGESRYDSAITLPESDPGNPLANSARMYVRQDEATGLTQLVARFADGDIDVLAEEAP